MDTTLWYELVGYVASVLILVSLMMKSLLRLRVVNLVGALVFTVYGLLIGAPPVWLVNGAIVLVDLWYLWQMLADDEHLEVLEVAPDGAYLRRFLAFHADDIATFVPGFAGVRPEHRAFLVLRDMVPAAVVLARVQDHTAAVDLDYAIPAYRDYTSGSFVYGGELLASLGVETVTTAGGAEAHERYLERMGFVRDGDRWRLDLSAVSRR